MSNSLAIGATTQTLRALLQSGATTDGLSGVKITTQPPDKARGSGATGKQLNLFLYQTTINPAWRNAETPRQQQPPALGLNLHYLVTAYGPDNDDNEDHQLLGSALRTLHDHPVLSREEIKNALASSGLQDQLERLRITPQPLNIEELSKLWATFQTQYRISAAFEVALILIDSRRSSTAPLPVLARGSEDRGPIAFASGFPALTGLEFPLRQPAVRLNETFKLLGQNLGVQDLRVQLEHPRMKEWIAKDFVELEIVNQKDDQLEVRLKGVGIAASDLSLWWSGFYTVSVVTEAIPGHSVSSNALAFGLASSITLDKKVASAGTIDLEVKCSPRLRDGQRMVLLFGERQVTPQTFVNPADPSQPSTLKFKLETVTADDLPYRVRLRVDGVDSLPVRIVNNPPDPPRLEFDPEQQIKVGA